MSERILNFSEFSKKYSNGNNDRSLDDLKGSAANFEEGFDDATYDGSIGPNRPVASGDSTTPPQPGDDGTSFDSDIDMELNPPEEITEPEVTSPDEEDIEETEGDEETEDDSPEPSEVLDSGEDEEDTEEDEEDEEDTEDTEEDDEDDEDEDVPEPEAGANPKKPKIIEESHQTPNLMSFKKFFESLAPNVDETEEEIDEVCEDCGEEDCDCNK